MSKYLKHYYVLADSTAEYVNTSNAPYQGRTTPAIVGLLPLFPGSDENMIDMCFSTCPDDSEVTPVENLMVVYDTYEAWVAEIQIHFNRLKEQRKQKAYALVLNILTRELQEWTHSSEQSLFIQKYEQAKKAILAEDDLAASLLAPFLAKEAEYRGITTKELAAKVLSNYDQYTDTQLKYAGLRGKAIDTINAVPFDGASIETITVSFNSVLNFLPESLFDL